MFSFFPHLYSAVVKCPSSLRGAERQRGSAPEDRGVWVCVLGLTRRAEPRMRTQPDAADRAAFGPAPSVYREGGTAAVTKARREEEGRKKKIYSWEPRGARFVKSSLPAHIQREALRLRADADADADAALHPDSSVHPSPPLLPHVRGRGGCLCRPRNPSTLTGCLSAAR